MTFNRQLLIGVFLTIIIASGVYYYFQQNQLKDIKIGITVALSGSSAALGQDSRDGMIMASEELKDKGVSLSLIFEDDQYDIEKTVTAFNKLLYFDGIRYVVTFGSGNSLAICPLAKEKRVFQVAISSDPKVLEYEYTIKVGSDPNEFGKSLAEEVIRRDYKRIYIIVSNYPAIYAFIDEFQKREGIAGRVIGESKVDLSETDFKTVLLKAKESNPDSILLEIIPGRVGILAKQAREMGITVPLFAAGVFEDQTAIDTAGGALEGQWFVNPEVSASFIKRFQSRFNRIPGREATNGYDSIMLIGNAIKEVGDDPVKVNDYLHKILAFDSDSVVGGVRVEKGNFIKVNVVKIVKGDTFVVYSGP